MDASPFSFPPFSFLTSAALVLPMLITALVGCAKMDHCGHLDQKPNPLSHRTPAISMFVENYSDLASSGESLIVSVWDDGFVIWSLDAIRGGPPYKKGRISNDQVKTVLQYLEHSSLLSPRSVNINHLGPDSAFTAITICTATHHGKVASWHELAELHPNVVATYRGLEPLDGKSREDVLAMQPEEYTRFREGWREIREKLIGLIPLTGADATQADIEVCQKEKK